MGPKGKAPILKYLRRIPRTDDTTQGQQSLPTRSGDETEDPNSFVNPLIRPEYQGYQGGASDTSFYLSPLPTEQPGFREWQLEQGHCPNSTPELTPFNQCGQTSSPTPRPDEHEYASQYSPTSSPHGLEDDEDTAHAAETSPSTEGTPERDLANGEVRTIGIFKHSHLLIYQFF
jgi:hypothetical protein